MWPVAPTRVAGLQGTTEAMEQLEQLGLRDPAAAAGATACVARGKSQRGKRKV